MLKATKTGTWPSNSPASGPSGTLPPKQLAIILGKTWKWLPWRYFYIIHIVVHPLNDACLNRSSKAFFGKPSFLLWKRRSTSGAANLEELSPYSPFELGLRKETWVQGEEEGEKTQDFEPSRKPTVPSFRMQNRTTRIQYHEKTPKRRQLQRARRQHSKQTLSLVSSIIGHLWLLTCPDSQQCWLVSSKVQNPTFKTHMDCDYHCSPLPKGREAKPDMFWMQHDRGGKKNKPTSSQKILGKKEEEMHLPQEAYLQGRSTLGCPQPEFACFAYQHPPLARWGGALLGHLYQASAISGWWCVRELQEALRKRGRN